MSIRAFTLFSSNSQAQTWLSIVTYPVLFLSLQVLSSFRPSTDVVLAFPSELALVEALKLISNIFIRYRSGEGLFHQTQNRTVLWDASSDLEDQPLRSLAGQESDERMVPSGEDVRREHLHGEPTTHTWLAVIYASIVWAGTTYIFTSALFLFDVATVPVAAATSTAFVLYGLYAFSGRSVTAPVSQSVVLQLLGILLANGALWRSSESLRASSLVLLSVAFSSACNVLLINNIYHSHTSASVNRLNTVLFSSGLCLHIASYAFQAIFTSRVYFPGWSLHRISTLIIRARLDWTILSVIRDHDAILERALYSLSVALLLLIISLHNKSLSLVVVAGSAVTLWASVSYVSKELYKSHHLHDTVEHKSSLPSRRRRIIAWTIFIALGLGSILGADEAILFRLEHSLAHLDILSLPAAQPVCQRKPLPVSPLYTSDDRTYKHFDDVLLIVFFSHPRYDTNLDSYREVYAEYFPNMVFVGPASREDAGFDHSYDVLVDTYQAAEDLSDPETYNMGGRMAHHMLYTALQEYPCYDGYLWAPFDTLLNVPRLQLFDQSKFWYHSPFGRYVPNRALDPSAIGNASFHAPPANISPDPANVTTPWKGWGEDWWWGSPHVGLPVCMPAFHNVPKAQRDRLAALTGQRDRLIGGSADTMYIPGRHRATFMSTLALFLQTNCFLEIAAPTTLHLALPRDEDILYVDHWWIWLPPFDTAFVRGQWAEGREVDTFHTFHWGEPTGDGGKWEPRPERVRDVRRLLQDSAARQGISFPN